MVQQKQLKCPFCGIEKEDEYALSEHLAAAHYSRAGNLKVRYTCFCGKIQEFSEKQLHIQIHLLGHLKQTRDPDLRQKILSEIDRLTR